MDIFMGLYVLVLSFMVWKLKQLDAISKDVVTRKEVEELIDKKFKDVDNEFDKFEAKLDLMSQQIVKIGVTLARIDERMKRDNG